MSELISREQFDQFRNSNWPQIFSGLAQTAREEGVAVDETGSFQSWDNSLMLVPRAEKEMLEDMGIIEDRLLHRNPITPSMVKDGFRGDPNDYVPRFTELGKEVISACENVFTPEEHEAANEAARPRLQALMAQVEAEFGPLN